MCGACSTLSSCVLVSSGLRPAARPTRCRGVRATSKSTRYTVRGKLHGGSGEAGRVRKTAGQLLSLYTRYVRKQLPEVHSYGCQHSGVEQARAHASAPRTA